MRSCAPGIGSFRNSSEATKPWLTAANNNYYDDYQANYRHPTGTTCVPPSS
jgi:hypothetical protein